VPALVGLGLETRDFVGALINDVIDDSKLLPHGATQSLINAHGRPRPKASPLTPWHDHRRLST